jgi:hypothetical protein
MKLLAASVLLSILLSVDSRAATTVEFCKPYTALSQLPVDLKQPYIQYTLGVTDLAGGKKAISITGDEIHVTRESLGVLVRAAAAVDRSIDSIRLDARVVKFSGQVPLSGGRIDVFAKDIEFEDGSSITLLPASNSRITLAAQNISLSDTGFHHFDVRARELTGPRDTFSDIDTILDVKASHLYVGGSEIAHANASGVLAQRFSTYPIDDFTAKITADVGDPVSAGWVDAERQAKVEWPRYSVAVLRSVFRISPFDDCAREDIKDAATNNLPTLKLLANGEAVFEAQTIIDAVDRGVDLNGNGPAYVSSRPLADVLLGIRSFEPGGSEQKTLKFYIDSLNDSISNTPISEDAQNAEVAKLAETIRQEKIDYANTNNELIELQSEIFNTTQLLTTQQNQYHDRETSLKNSAAELKKGNADRAELLAGLSTAAAIASTAYTGSPQTGSVVGGVILAVGEAGQGRPVFSSLSAGYQFSVAIKGPLTSIQKTITDLYNSRGNYGMFIDSLSVQNITIKNSITVPVTNPAPGQPATKTITRDEALADLAAKGEALKTGIQGIEGVYNNFKESASPVSDDIEDDGSLENLAEHLTTTLESAKNQAIKLDAVQRQVQQQSVLLVQSAEQLARVTNLPIIDEANRRTFQQLSIDGFRDEVSKFAELTDEIRRVSLVEYRAQLPVDVAQIESVLVSEQLDQGFDQKASLNSADIATKYLNALKAQKDLISLLASALDKASDRQFYAYVKMRGSAPVQVIATEQINTSQHAPQDKKEFIARLNKLVQEEFNARSNLPKLDDLYKQRIAIPFDLVGKLDQRFPTRLLQAVVVGVLPKFNLKGSDLAFRIEVERVGNLRKSSGPIPNGPARTNLSQKVCAKKNLPQPSLDCFSVDLREKDTPEEFQNSPFDYSIGTVLGGHAFVPTPIESYWYLHPGDTAPGTRTTTLTYAPAEARMYLGVRLDPRAAWVTAPKFTEMTVTVEAFQ